MLTGQRVMWPWLSYGIITLVMGVVLLVGALVLVNLAAPGTPAWLVVVPPGVLIGVGLVHLWSVYGAKNRWEQYVLTPTGIFRRRKGETWEPLIELHRLRRIQAGPDTPYVGVFRVSSLWIVDEDHNSVYLGPLRDAPRWVELVEQMRSQDGVEIEAVVMPDARGSSRRNDTGS